MSTSASRTPWGGRLGLLSGAAVLVLATAQPTAAQTLPSAMSDAWLGCWMLRADHVTDATAIDPLEIPLRSPGEPSDVRVCVARSDDDSGFVLTTYAGSQPALTQTIVPDGREHPIDEVGCRGTTRAEWSRNRDRLFTRAELACNEGAPRTISQLAMMIRGGTWLDIQSVTTEGRESMRVRRYRRAPGEAGATLSAVPTEQLTLADVRELSAKVSPRVVEAALLETRSRFDLDGETMIALDDAGVPDSVTDLMVALSYPEHFTVERPAAGGGYGVISDWGAMPGWSYGDPYLWGLYSPYAYGFWGHTTPWGFPGYGWVVVEDGAGEPSEPRDHGRVVEGLGYTRVRPREPVAIRRGTDSTSGTGSTSGTTPASSPESGGVSTGGYSSGSGSGSGRTAQPRPPGKPQ